MERYRTIIDDWTAFREACGREPKSAVRKNSIKAGEDFEERLQREFDSVEQSSWNSRIYRLDRNKPGKSIMHWMGEYYVQEESAAVPVEILDPHPGDRILDMCAAPGGKTTQIASRIGNSGTVIANDNSAKRLQSLHANIYRTGSASARVTNYDGRQIPENEKFDRVLVDAPCTGEGDLCRRRFESARKEDIEDLAELQKQLMEKAARLVEKGGSLVYSTCTLAPEENEEVVQHVLDKTELELQRPRIEAPHATGIGEFRNKSYGGELSKTIRVYPHHLDSGVIFVALLRR